MPLSVPPTVPPVVSEDGDFRWVLLNVKVKEWRRVLNYENLPKLRSWGLEVNTKMMQVEARVLNPPPVTYKGGKTLRANFG